MRRGAPVLLAAALLAGCGHQGDDKAPARKPAPPLVSFQRNGGLAATLDKLTVSAKGTARLDKRYGGAGRRYEDFALTPSALARLRADLRRLPAHLKATGTPTPQGATFILRYGRSTYTAQEGAIDRAARPAFALLSALVDGSGRGRLTRELRQGPPS